MTGRIRTRGPQYPVDDAWKSAIRALMERQGISQAEMARRIPCSPAMLVLLFKPETIQSGFVPAIHRVLGLEPPAISTTVSERDDASRRLARIWRELSQDEREILLAVAVRFRRSDG